MLELREKIHNLISRKSFNNNTQGACAITKRSICEEKAPA
jgi:hypothetical protein